MEQKRIDEISLILKNSKINLLLASNNLNYFKNIQDFKVIEKMVSIIKKLDNIGYSIEQNFKWLEQTKLDYNEAEILNENLINKLLQDTEKIVIKDDNLQIKEESSINKV